MDQESLYTEVLHKEAAEVRKSWGWLLTIGVILLLLGVLALSSLYYSSILSVLLLASILLSGGLVQIGYAIFNRKNHNFFVSLTMGVLYSVLGLILFINPALTLAGITLIMAIVFLVSGFFKVVSAFSYRGKSAWWMGISGILSLILGILILAGLPSVALWVVGLFIGVELLIAGITLSLLAFDIKNISITELESSEIYSIPGLAGTKGGVVRSDSKRVKP